MNLMGEGYMSQLSYDEIYEWCRQYSWGNEKHEKGSRDIAARIKKTYGSGTTHFEIGNLSESFKKLFSSP